MKARWTACLLALALLLCPAARADITWPAGLTDAQARMRAYVERVNQCLLEQGSGTVNSLFECYPTFLSAGITEGDMADIPEDIELIVWAGSGSLDKLELNVRDMERFITVAAACIWAASPEQISVRDARKLAEPYYSRVKASPTDSFADRVDEMKGEKVRLYFEYRPARGVYMDDGTGSAALIPVTEPVLVMTLIFPIDGANDGVSVAPSPAPETHLSNDDGNPDWDGGGYLLEEDEIHFEFFTTPTPEPDSAVYD